MELPGRQSLVEHIGACLARGAHGALLVVLRVRKLAAIGELMGDDAAGQVLAAVPQRLAQSAPAGAFIASLGEGAYAVACNGSAEAPAAIAERLVAAVSSPITHQGRVLYAPANAGVCAIDGAGDASAVLERGLRALQQAMANGPGAVESISAARIDRDMADWEMRTLLDEAGLRGEFTLQYQPIHLLASGEVLKLEALLRWECAAYGRVSPERFVPMLEDSGLIRSVGQWLLQEAGVALREWRRAVGVPVRLAVNVSPVQLASPDFVESARKAVAEAGCEPAWFDLEVTEGVLIRDFARVRAQLEALAAMGFGIVIDDFGAGYSSLGQLGELPVQHIKLDRSLIAGLPDAPRSARIVRAVLALAEALELGVTVEGVERPEQAAWLQRFPGLHCQGYLFSRPVAAAEVPSLLQRHGAAQRLPLKR